MRTFEILILATLLVRFVGCALPPIKRARWIDWLPSLAMLLIVLHLVVEKFRWQMVPAFGLALLLFLLSIPRLKRGSRPSDTQPSRRVRAILGFLFRLLIFVFVAALPLLLPVFRLPTPTGPYPVGTTKLYLVDQTRPETFTPNPDDHREFMVQVWYPAQVEPGARRATYWEGLPPLFSHLSLVRSQTYQDVPVSKAQSAYPVLIFSHGYVGFIEQNLTQMEELASHGYVVCSMAHTYHTIATVFPDGRVVPADSALSNDFIRGKSPTQAVYARDLRIWTDDTIFLIDELERLQAGERESTLAGKLDMARLGIWGTSFGGVTAVEVCAMDDRCQAGIDLDASLPKEYTGSAVNSPLKKPIMFMSNEGRAYYMPIALGAVNSTAYAVIIHGTTHFNFGDMALYSPLLKFTQAFGPIDAQRMIEIVNAYALAFFDKHLKGETAPLLDGPSTDYPDVEFRVHVP